MGMGTLTPNTKALLDLTANDKGFLVPRLTSAERININPTGSGDAALLVYNTDDNLFYFWNSTQWVAFPQQGGSNNISLSFDANTGTLSLTDNGGTLTTNIPPDNDSDPTNEIQDLSLSNNILSLSISNNNVDLSPYVNTDAQTLSLSGNTLSISNGNNVDLSNLTGDDWKLIGNSGTNPATNFLGTTDAQDLVLRTNNAEQVRVSAAGNVGIGSATPAQKLEVVGNVRASGEFISTNANQARFIQGDYGLIHRNDGANYYMLLTDAGDQYGSWNSLRPFRINDPTGDIFLGGEVLTVKHGTNVGIGEPNPTRKLHLNGNAYIFRNNPPVDNAAYTNTHIELITNDGSVPGIGFHRAGLDAFALYYAGGNPPNIRYRDNGGNDGRVMTNRGYSDYSAQRTTTGVTTVTMITLDSGFCFLTGQTGVYNGFGEQCNVVRTATNWELQAIRNSGSGVECKATCVNY